MPNPTSRVADIIASSLYQLDPQFPGVRDRAEVVAAALQEAGVIVSVTAIPLPPELEDVINGALLHIQDSEGRDRLPMVPWYWNVEIAKALRAAGWGGRA